MGEKRGVFSQRGVEVEVEVDIAAEFESEEEVLDLEEVRVKESSSRGECELRGVESTVFMFMDAIIVVGSEL